MTHVKVEWESTALASVKSRGLPPFERQHKCLVIQLRFRSVPALVAILGGTFANDANCIAVFAHWSWRRDLLHLVLSDEGCAGRDRVRYCGLELQSTGSPRKLG